MKKSLFILATAAIALASCSKDKTVEVNETLLNGDEISFRGLESGVKKAPNAAGVKTIWEENDQFNVYANYNSAKYFQDDFKHNGSTFSSTNKYYWPSNIGTKYTLEEYNTAKSTSLDQSAFDALSDLEKTKPEAIMTFTAIWGATQTDGTAGEVAAYSPASVAASQKDILVAQHQSIEKESPVPMNFRHALSQIIVKAKNSNPNLKVTITGVRIGYVKTQGTLSYASGVSDTQDASNIAQGNWSCTDFAGTPTTTTANDYKYDQIVSLTLTGKVDDAQGLLSYAPWLLLPQNMTNADTDSDGTPNYATTKNGTKGTANPDFAGSYIALNMQVENYNGSSATGTIVSTQWCYWPITTAWNPGYKYTYTIDVAGGGYEPEDTDNDGEGDPVLDGAVITFSISCTIDGWDDSEVAVSGGI